MPLKYIKLAFGKKNRKGILSKNRIQRRTEKLGIGEDLIQKVLKGDKTSLIKLGEYGKEGRRIQMAMPLIEKNSVDFLQGLAMYNDKMANIYIAGGQAGRTIDKSQDRLELANKKYINDGKLQSEKRKLDNRLEDQRFTEQQEIQRLSAYVTYWMSSVDHQFALDNLNVRAEIAQLNEDERQMNSMINHYLQHGEAGNDKYLPEKDYTTVSALPSAKSIPFLSSATTFVKKAWTRFL